MMKAIQKDDFVLCYIKDLNKEETDYLEDLNNFISTGEVNFMIQKEDFDRVKSILYTQLEKNQDSYDLLKKRLKAQFHIIYA